MRKLNIPKPVIYLGVASLLSDIASEAIYPILPYFLTATLGASVLFVGVLEGVVEAISSILKLISGYYSDKWKKREPFVLVGYLISIIVRPLIGFTYAPLQVLAVRFGDRVGKGIRTAPRDAWLAEHSTTQSRGKVFGFHRGMDHAGATIAPLLAAGFLFAFPGEFRTLFILTAIPGLLALIYVQKAITARGPHSAPQDRGEKIEFSKLTELPRRFKFFLLILLFFTLSLSTDAFLILRLNELGVSPAWITVIWAGHNAVKMFSSFWGGSFSDQVGHRNSIFIGWLLYAVIYFLLGIANSATMGVILLLIYGIYYGLTESAEKAFVVEMVPKSFHGTALGLFHLILGVGAIPASFLFGTLWQRFGSQTAFWISAFISVLATLLFGTMFLRAKNIHESR